ncbi:MAG: pepsin-like aspartic protease [Polyangiaceae bacterium]|jgi:hypothetical protein
MDRLRSLALSLPAAFALLASSACGGGAANAGGGTATDSGTSSDSPVPEAEDAALDGGEPEANPDLVTIALSVCAPSLVYMAPATVGSQSFQLLVDTGSTTLAVASSACSGCGVTPEYTPGSSAVDEHQTATSQYGTGSWTGEIYQDTVALGSAATPVKLAAIDTQSDFFQDFTCSMQGVAGFGPAGAALPGTNAYFDDLVASAKMPDVFATQLCDGSGTLWLGGYDPSAATGAPQYVPLASGALSDVYYSVSLTSVTVAGTTVPIATKQFADSVVDTGTAGFLLQTSAYDALTAAIQSDAAFTEALGSSFFASQTGGVACAASTATKAALDAALPPLTLTFGSVSIQAAPTDSYLFPYMGKAWCSSLVTDPSVSSELPLASIIGSPMLRSSIVVFDRAKNRIGFAPHAPCP